MHLSLRKKYIGNAAFYKMALAVAVPIMIQNGITNFVSLLDNIMVGRVGTEQMTGVAIVNQLIFVFNLAIFGAVSGAGIFGAQYYGKGDWDGVRQTFRFKLLVCTALTVLGACIFLLFGEDLILLYLKGDGSPEQIAASLGYAKNICSSCSSALSRLRWRSAIPARCARRARPSCPWLRASCPLW